MGTKRLKMKELNPQTTRTEEYCNAKTKHRQHRFCLAQCDGFGCAGINALGCKDPDNPTDCNFEQGRKSVQQLHSKWSHWTKQL